MLNKFEIEIFYSLVEKLTNTCQQGNYRKEHLLQAFEMRMNELKTPNLKDYLRKLALDTNEMNIFLNIITIHTTSWFREFPHFEDLIDSIETKYKHGQRHFNVLSCSCSTGQETYSIGLIFESLKAVKTDLTYKIEAFDLDNLSLCIAKEAKYKIDELSQIPKKFLLKDFIEVNQQNFKISYKIIDNITFRKANLKSVNDIYIKFKFDNIFIRNVLIYFEHEAALKIIDKLNILLNNNGLIHVGHAEFPVVIPQSLDRFSSSSLVLKDKNSEIAKKEDIKLYQELLVAKKKKILIVDDFAVIRSTIRNALGSKFDFDEAESAEVATELVKNNNYDLITLDLNMPGESGIQWLKRQRSLGLHVPVVIISSAEAKDAEGVLGALSEGAQDYISKEMLNQNKEMVVDTLNALIQKQDAPISIKNSKNNFKNKYKVIDPQVIAIGSSTGGPDALWKLLKNLPKPLPPIIIVQHISHRFMDHFATTLKRVSGFEIKGEVNDEVLMPNTIYVARGDYHMTIKNSNKGLVIKHEDSELRNGFRPSVDILFNSIAREQVPSVSIILTGMGCDGAQGMLNIYNRNKSMTVAQSESSCIVFGMPKEAIEKKAVDVVGDLFDIRSVIDNIHRDMKRKQAG